MPVLGITGGVATGKSTFTAQLAAQIEGACVVDADRTVHDLLDSDPGVAEEVASAFGETVRAPGGGVSRPALREIVFASAEKRRVLEEILHPRVRQHWMEAAREAQGAGVTLLVDIPLLFETGAEEHLERTIVVAASEETQMQRLTSIRSLPSETARRMIEAQLPMPEKISRATHVVWNEGTLEPLREQAELIAALVAA